MKKYKDLTNEIIGSLMVVSLDEDKFDSNGTTKLWKCKCKCGKFTYKSARKLIEAIKNKKNISCGCASQSDLVGQKFGDYEIIKFAYSDIKNKYWLCKCKCGDTFVKSTKYLHKSTCKCKKSQTQDTITRQKLKKILHGMKRRCYDNSNKSFNNYGGRGIKICNEWLSNSNHFVEWAMNHGYKYTLQIDRIDNDGDYTPDNCRWVDSYIQANNKRNNRNITYNGKTQCLRMWCRELNLPYRKTHKRIYTYNWDIEKCFDKSQRVGF